MGLLGNVVKSLGNLAAPVVSGAFGIGSSILGNIGQNSANKTNMRIAQMNNEWSEKMMEKQHLYDIEMFNLNNAYNTPDQQVKRLQAAGLNPALALGNVSPGMAQGSNSVGLPSPAQAKVEPMRYDGYANSINNSIQTAIQLDRHNSEMHALGTNTAMQEAETRAKIAEIFERTKDQRMKNEISQIMKDIRIGHENEQFLKTINERFLLEEQEKLIIQQRIAQELINNNLPEKLSMDIAVLASTRDLNKHNAQHEISQLIDTCEKKLGRKLNEREKKFIFEAVKKIIVYKPTANMTNAGAAATIGSVVGDALK